MGGGGAGGEEAGGGRSQTQTCLNPNPEAEAEAKLYREVEREAERKVWGRGRADGGALATMRDGNDLACDLLSAGDTTTSSYHSLVESQ